MTHRSPPTEKELAAIEYMKAHRKGTVLEDDVHFNVHDERLLLRFARQKDAVGEKALALLEEAIAWRRETKPHQIQYEQVEAFAKLHIQIPLGFSKQGVPVVYFKPRPNDVLAEGRVKFNLWLLEEHLRRGYDEIVFVLDFDTAGRPSDEDTKTRETMDKVRKHFYPLMESLILVLNLPLLLRPLFAIVIKFMSHAQQETMKSGLKPKHLLEYIDVEQLNSNYEGGKLTAVADIREMLPPPKNAKK